MIAPGAEEADAGHDLRGDARRIGSDDRPAADEELVEAVGGDDREERRAERDEQVRADAGLAVAQLALEADRAPSPAAIARRSSASQLLSVGISLTRSCNGLLLEALQLLDPGRRQVEQLVEPRAVERDLARPSTALRRTGRRRVMTTLTSTSAFESSE